MDKEIQMTSKDGNDYLYPRTKAEIVLGLTTIVLELENKIQETNEKLLLIDGGTF